MSYKDNSKILLRASRMKMERQNEGKYTEESRERVYIDTWGVLVGG
jgi:hypothetical protein